MKNLSAKWEYGGVVVTAGGGDYTLLGKRYVLEAGAVVVEPQKAPVTDVDIPAIGEYPPKTIRGLTDPQLVCMGRRAWSAAAFGLMKGRDGIPFDVPTEEDARKELFSGRDIFGYEWPSPVIPLNALG